MNAIALVMQSPLVKHSRKRFKRPYKNTMKCIDSLKQAFGDEGDDPNLSGVCLPIPKLHA